MKFEKRTNALDPYKEMLEAQAVVLSRARDLYLAKDAERKNFEAKLIDSASGKSHAERVIKAQATDAWLKFHKELARLTSVWEFQKLKYEILDKEWLAQYLTLKSDEGLIKRQVG